MIREGGARKAQQRGGFILGMIVGLLVGLAIALGVALYIAKVPVPFMDKVGHRTAEQDAAEAEKLKGWDPNAGLVGKPVPRPNMNPPSAPVSGMGGDPAAVALRPATDPASAASRPAPVQTAPVTAAPPRPARDPAAILAGEPAPVATLPPGVDPFTYFVQAGAFSSANDAEQQRARLAIQGLVAKVSEREQGGRTVYRVRLGPYDSREEAERLQERLKATGAESALVRVERSKP